MNTTVTTKSEQGGNPDQQNHNPQLHRQNFRTQTQNFFQKQLHIEPSLQHEKSLTKNRSNPFQ